MPVYHFSIGNSTVGPVGFCVAVRAQNRKEALAHLRSELPAEMPVVKSRHGTAPGVEYLQVYFNPEAITIADVDFVEEA